MPRRTIPQSLLLRADELSAVAGARSPIAALLTSRAGVAAPMRSQCQNKAPDAGVTRRGQSRHGLDREESTRPSTAARLAPASNLNATWQGICVPRGVPRAHGFKHVSMSCREDTHSHNVSLPVIAIRNNPNEVV
jgi:hypothetical protein